MPGVKKLFKFLITFFIAVGCTYGGYVYGAKSFATQIKKNPPKIVVINKLQPGNAVNTSEDFTLFWQVWDLVAQNYLMRPVNPQKLMEGAISGVESYGKPKEAAKSDPAETIQDQVQQSTQSSQSSQSPQSLSPVEDSGQSD